ncbi:MAG: hypothetical protein EAZ85_01985 [Bacteroidetes bacterium]|nr:MAG: hypothetical protein EAZ85_01985 [Bacteroidota bacterium]
MNFISKKTAETILTKFKTGITYQNSPDKDGDYLVFQYNSMLQKMVLTTKSYENPTYEQAILHTEEEFVKYLMEIGEDSFQGKELKNLIG